MPTRHFAMRGFPAAAAVLLLLSVPVTCRAAAADPVAAESRISAVTLYERSALVTRSVQVPAEEGLLELVVGPLPPSLQPSSLYAEAAGGEEGLRILTTRFRQRVERDSIDERVRELERALTQTRLQLAQAAARQTAAEEDLAFLQQLSTFTAATTRDNAGGAGLDAQAVIELSSHIADRRRALVEERVAVAAEVEALAQQVAYQERQLQSERAAADRVVREAVVVVDNPQGQAGQVRLSYLVDAASWKPAYKLRAERDGSGAVLEYLASIRQQSGEDWSAVSLTLSTATPRLNAAPPELSMLGVVLGPPSGAGARPRVSKVEAAEELQRAQAQYDVQSAGPPAQRAEANVMMNRAGARMLEADLFGDGDSAGPLVEGQSITFNLPGRASIPWRDDEQLVEIDRVQLRPDFSYKAVPVLTPHVYRLAEVDNTSERVILPGPAMMYLNGDFVGAADLPLVAAGEAFTAGFGVDPAIKSERRLLQRREGVQGGNRVITLRYALRLRSYKDADVAVHLWDRLPQPPQGQGDAVTVNLVETSHPLSEGTLYLRDERPLGLLRWDLELPAGGEVTVEYEYTVAFDRNFDIAGFEAN